MIILLYHIVDNNNNNNNYKEQDSTAIATPLKLLIQLYQSTNASYGKVEPKQSMLRMYIRLVWFPLFNDISIFVDYLIPKPSLMKTVVVLFKLMGDKGVQHLSQGN